MAENQSFAYTGMNSTGKRVDGVINAIDLKEAQLALKRRGIEVISLTPKRVFKLSFGRKKVKIKDVQLFTRFLSTMLGAGLPIIQALDIIARDQTNPAMHSLIISIRNEVSGGKTLAETFGQYPDQFSPLYCSLIKAGEKSGTLEKILDRLAGYLEKTETLKRKIKKSMMYPIVIFSIAAVVSGILLIFVVPQFQKMFASFGANLPAFTLMIVHLSNLLRHYWWLLLGGLILFIIFWKYSLKKNEAVQQRLAKLTLNMYILGPIFTKGIIARFTRTLATTMEAGMPIVEAMKTMAPVMGNAVYTRAVLHICDEINSGQKLSTAMQSTKLFPNMVIQMISIGESSGKLSEMLNKIADFYEEEVNNIVDNLSSLLEPLIMVILGIVVGGFVIAMYLPIFRMGSLF